ncbi:hypothetical protein Emed_007042 [Eimeria media]
MASRVVIGHPGVADDVDNRKQGSIKEVKGEGTATCYQCGGAGHTTRECPGTAAATRKPGSGCNKCVAMGHWGQACPFRAKRVALKNGKSEQGQDRRHGNGQAQGLMWGETLGLIKSLTLALCCTRYEGGKPHNLTRCVLLQRQRKSETHAPSARRHS